MRTSRIINYYDSGLSNSFKQQLEADNEQQVALELTPKAQVLEGGRKFRVLKIAFPGVFNRYFPLWMPCCSVRSEYMQEGEHYAVEMSQAFHGITRFKCFTDPFNVFQNWEIDALQFYSMVLIFFQQLWYKEIKVAI